MEINFSNSSKEEIFEFHKKISKNVKYFRNNKKLTQLDLALDIGIKSVAFFSNCENNKYDKHFNIEHLYKISKSLQVNIEDFFQ
ncbi:MAG: helix-turn-helix transcriptional regulator [Epsilonproteobacteria bacterium]|nr:helix-turn-helix transcriptional regulator [Campylobacterota bacterium]